MTGGLPSGHRAHDGGALADFDVVAIAGLECMESTRRATNTGLAVLHHIHPQYLTSKTPRVQYCMAQESSRRSHTSWT